MALGKKTKKTKEELDLERQERIEKTHMRLQAQVMRVKTLKQGYAREGAMAKAMNRPQELAKAKQALACTIALENQMNGMLINLELAVSNRDLANISAEFMQIMAEISMDIIVDGERTNLKKTKNLLLKGAYRQKQQSEKIDQMLDACSLTSLPQGAGNVDMELNAEIDSLIDGVGKMGGFGKLDSNLSGI